MHDERVHERSSIEEGQLVMPFYIICDVSYSMSGDMKDLNDGLERLHRAIVAQPVADDVAQICIMSFSTTAKVLMPLGQMSEVSVPTLSVEGSTNYGAAFRELAHTIERDRTALKAQGFKIYRPCAFFLTDGEPTDSDWHQTFKDTLTYEPGDWPGNEGASDFRAVRVPGRHGEGPAPAGVPAGAGEVVSRQEHQRRAGAGRDPRHHHEDGGGIGPDG